MRQRTTSLAGAALLAAALWVPLSGCSAAQDAVSAAGQSASSAAVDAARQAALEEACALVGDGQLSDSDLTTLRGVVATAKAAGVQGDVIDRADDLLGTSGGQDGAAGVEQGQVQQFQAACTDAGEGS